MKTTIQQWEFTDKMVKWFSYNGANALFEYLEDLERDIGEEIEFDPVAIRCDYSEYENLEEIKEHYNIETMEDLEKHTTVIEFKGGIIIQQF